MTLLERPSIAEGLASPHQATTDQQLITLWLHGRSPHTQRAYRADVDRFLMFVATPLTTVTLGDIQAFAPVVARLAGT